MALALGTLAGATLYNLYENQIRDADTDIESEYKELEVLLPTNVAEKIQWQLDPHMGWVVFNASDQLLHDDPIVPAEAARAALGKQEVVTTGGLVQAWRVKSFPGGPGRTIVVGYDMVKVHGVLSDIVTAYTWSLPLVVIVAVAGSWWATTRALAPFRALADAIEGIQSEHLERQRRVPEPPAQDEIRRLAVSFNALLARFEKSFAQTKRFAADASHELRTPLTIMRSEVERALGQSSLPAAPTAALVSLQDEIARIDRITEQLLQLARFDAGQIALERTRVDFSALLSSACEDAELLASAAGVSLEVAMTPLLWVWGDPNHLRRLLLNLLDNACKHNRPGGRVHCSLRPDDGGVVFRIGNTGQGIPAAMRERVFERFFRAEVSRPGNRGHGLGLALCREIVGSHAGCLTLLNPAEEDWTEFEVRLPSVDSAS